jgi:hypothetical protein
MVHRWVRKRPISDPIEAFFNKERQAADRDVFVFTGIVIIAVIGASAEDDNSGRKDSNSINRPGIHDAMFPIIEAVFDTDDAANIRLHPCGSFPDAASGVDACHDTGDGAGGTNGFGFQAIGEHQTGK